MNYRNPRILALAADHSCQACGLDDGTVVAAHGNSSRYGKGMSIKAHDLPAYLCCGCHAFVDWGSGSRAVRDSVWRDAFLKSLPLYEHLLSEEGRRLAEIFKE